MFKKILLSLLSLLLISAAVAAPAQAIGSGVVSPSPSSNTAYNNIENPNKVSGSQSNPDQASPILIAFVSGFLLIMLFFLLSPIVYRIVCWIRKIEVRE